MSDRERKVGSFQYDIYIYKGAFSLRDEIGTCPNIEVGIDVMDKSPFLLDHIMLEKKTRK